VRPLNLRQRKPIPVYGSTETLETVRRTFSYVFENANPESTIPNLTLHPQELEPFDVAGLMVEPVLLHHGRTRVYGYIFGNAAYLTDHSFIPDATMERLYNLEVLFLDALRYKPHPTHTTLHQAIRYVEELSPKRAFFTHLSHDLPHDHTESMLPDNIRLAYDGLRVTVEDVR
jgi:phosphoribosyl 1,2-cyclic phosphate phosphodiesterase